MAQFALRNDDGPIGAEIAGLDLAQPFDAATFARIEAAVHDRAVVVVRDQADLPGPALVAFAHRFGTPQVNVRAEANSRGAPDIFWVSNVTEGGRPLGSHDAGRYWHSDLCYLERPSKVTLLHALEVPMRDGVARGDTLFASACAAWEALPAKMKLRLDGLTAANSYRAMWNRKAREFGLRPELDEAGLATLPADAIHPVARTHPATGRKCLFVCEGYTSRICGLPEAESRALLDELFAHLARPEFRYRHRWRVGDLLVWDNCAVQHLASFDYPPTLRRRMQRCTVEGSIPY